jgi:hypothetical protein
MLLYLVFWDADILHGDLPLLFCYGWKIFDVELCELSVASTFWVL